MGKKNKNKKTGQTGDEPQGHQEQSRPQQQPRNQQCPLNPQREENMPQQQQQPKEPQPPQQKQQKQRPQPTQQQQQTPQQQQQQQLPQQQQQQQQRPQHQPSQQQQQRAQQHQQQQKPQGPQQQQQPKGPQPPQQKQQKQRPQQQQQQQQQQSAQQQQQQQQKPQQQQQEPQLQQQEQRPQKRQQHQRPQKQQQQQKQQQPSQQQQQKQQQPSQQQQQWRQQQYQHPQQQQHQWSQQQPPQQQQQQLPQQHPWSHQQHPPQQQQQWSQQQQHPPQQQQKWSQQQQHPPQQQQRPQQQQHQQREQQWPHRQQQHEIARSQSGSQQSISSGASTPQSSGAIPKQSQPSSRASSSVSDTPSPHVTPRQESIPKSLSKASVFSVVTQKSIPPGTLGIKGEAEANYLTLDLRNMPDVVYHYDVTITPDRPKKFYRDAFNKFMEDYLKGHCAAYDGSKNCYLLKLLPQPVYEGDVQVTDAHGKSIKFNISIKATENPAVELKSLKTYHNERVFDKPMRALQCVEVVLANACHQKGVRAGRSFYTKPREGYTDLGDGFELYVGLYQAAILGEQPYVNVDISHKSFPSEVTLTDFLTKQLSANLERNLETRTLYNFCSHMKGLKVIYNPPAKFGQAPRSYKVNEISREGAAKLSFTNNDGEKMTVQQYFASRGYNLRYPFLNCVVSGSAVRPNYLPIELCSIEPGQAIKRKDGVKQVQRMIKYAATSTGERKFKIMDLLYKFDHNKDPLVRAFGLAVGREFIKVPTRLLSPPAIEYRSNKCVKPQAGSWRGFNFLKTGASPAKTGYKWAIIYTQSYILKFSLLQEFSSKLYNSAARMGINLSAERQVEETKNIIATLEQYKRENYDLVVVVIPGRGTTYADIKQKAELVCGLLTQCIKEQTLSRGIREQLLSNLLLKVNSKLNGTNHKISSATHIVLDHPMFMGADVTHPSPDQRHIPSVVGVAASHDLDGASYNMQYRLQQSTKEEIDDMQSISRHHLKVYFQRQKCYPNHIIYYRDGVSDGQFQKVEQFELGAIRAVCKELRFSPKITCIIVVKRHHTRFFPIIKTTDSFNNVLPGTVVDQKIVHPNETQFFMVSHQSIQGTAKPTRYNVIVDDAKFTMDQLQQMTNNLCYMFPRCNRAVSYPAPAYLAHLVAARGRVYIEGPPLKRSLPEEYKRRLINENFMNNTPMFFV